MKSSDSAKDKAKKAEKKKSKKAFSRSVGRNVYWRKDRVPKLLIENLHGSGSGIDFGHPLVSGPDVGMLNSASD